MSTRGYLCSACRQLVDSENHVCWKADPNKPIKDIRSIRGAPMPEAVAPSAEQIAAAKTCCPCWGDGVTGPHECGEQTCELHARIAALLASRESPARAEGWAQARERAAVEVDTDVCGGDSPSLRRHWAALIRALEPPAPEPQR